MTSCEALTIGTRSSCLRLPSSSLERIGLELDTYWNVEKKAGGKIRCTGSYAVEWPPVFVKGAVPKHVKGVMATFGTVKRAGKLQLTVNGLPAYTYHRDTANVVLCDNVDGWFVVRP